MSIRIEQVDTRSAPEALLRALHDLYAEWDRERTPSDPVVPWNQRLVDWRFLRPEIDVPRWIATDGERAVGTAGLFHHRTQDTANSFGWVYVAKSHRGEGLARNLLRPAIEYAIADGRTRYLTEVPENSPNHQLALDAGLKLVYNERISQLRMADVDQSLMQKWIESASERASDYELLHLEFPIVSQYREALVAITEVMNTAPIEDLEEEPFTFTLEELDSLEREQALKGSEVLFVVAVHKPTGEFAGYTNLAYQSHHPVLAHQWDTGVNPAHRNKGLGRWIKAAMIQRLIEEYPAVEIIETENAESNEPMLNINIEMGFRPSLDAKVYQGDIRQVHEFLK